RPNLLVVTIDTLRADHVGAYGYAGAETPVMDGLGRRGARFENVLSAVPITGPAHATLFTGQYPPVHGVRENVAFTPGARPTIPTRRRLLTEPGSRAISTTARWPSPTRSSAGSWRPSRPRGGTRTRSWPCWPTTASRWASMVR